MILKSSTEWEFPWRAEASLHATADRGAGSNQRSRPNTAQSAVSFIPTRTGDGYAEGDVFPKGAYRPPDSEQRGSVMDMPLYPGDPLTPGVGATPWAQRLAMKDVQVFTKIAAAADFVCRCTAAPRRINRTCGSR